MGEYKGEYIWIIGASSGIGAALAQELAQQGAVLALSARREEKLKEIIAKLPGEGHMAVPMDAGDEAALSAGFESIKTNFPKLDRAVYLAAIYNAHDGKPKTLEFIHNALRVNIGGVFNMMHYLTPFYKGQGHGQAVICASVAGYRGLPTGQPYCATKAALNNLAESLYLDLSPQNIDVKVINPGFVETPLTDKNEFQMPMIIKADEAARRIAKGMKARAFEIHFPKRFTYIMKLLNIMPNWLYFMIAKRIV